MAIDCQHSWYRRPPPSGALSPSVPEVSASVELPTQTVETRETGADPASQPDSPDVRVLVSQDTHISADSAAAESAGVPSPPVSDPLFSDQPSASAVPSVSDSVLGLVPSVPEDPVPSVTDSALAEVDMSLASADPVPSISDSALAQVDIPPLPDVPALDLTQPDGNGDDDDMGDSAAPLEAQQLATAWKRVSRKKGQHRKNLARKAAASHSFAPARKATRPNPPGARPNRGKDPPE